MRFRPALAKPSILGKRLHFGERWRDAERSDYCNKRMEPTHRKHAQYRRSYARREQSARSGVGKWQRRSRAAYRLSSQDSGPYVS